MSPRPSPQPAVEKWAIGSPLASVNFEEASCPSRNYWLNHKNAALKKWIDG